MSRALAAVAAVMCVAWARVVIPDVGASIAQLAEEKGYPIEEFCEDVFWTIGGVSANLNLTRMQVYVSFPAGTSTKNIAHWSQGIKTDAFQMFDYGCGLFSCGNQDHYGQRTPPQYDLSKVTVPTALYAGTNDFLADLKDVEHLVAHLPNSTVVATNIVKGFAHFDFTWGTNARNLVYADILGRLAEFVEYTPITMLYNVNSPWASQ